MKKRITLTIDKDLLKKVDSSIDNNIIKNRSHAVELLVRNSLQTNAPTKALILAGGSDRTIELENKNILQSLIRIDGKTIIERNIDLLKNHGIKDIIISLCKEQKELKNHLKDGSEQGVNISYLEEKEPLGTSGAVREARKHFNDAFLVCNADEIKDIDISKMYEFHKSHNGKATIALTTSEDQSDYGVAVLNGHKIVTFVEKPVRGSEPSKLINAGLYILEPEIITLLPEGFSRFEYDVFPKLAAEESLNGFVFSGQWFSLDSIDKYEKAKRDWKNK